jgi:hypothetical protein
MPRPTTCYVVLDYHANATLYIGKNIDKAAERIEPGLRQRLRRRMRWKKCGI